MMMSSYQVGQLVEKMSNPDKDYRFMAINDLIRELTQTEFKLDDDSASKVVRALIKLLGDSNGEVQNLAIKCIGALAQPGRVKQHYLEFIVDELCKQIISKNEASRDVNTMGMKMVIANLPPVGAGSPTIVLMRKIVPKFINAIAMNSEDDACRIDTLDLLADVLLRFGDAIKETHKDLSLTLLTALQSNRQAIKKRATTALGHLSAVVDNTLYNSIVEDLLRGLSEAKSSTSSRTYIVSLTFIAKSSGSRFSGHAKKVIPYLVKHLRTSEDDELKEAALQGLETFLQRCPAVVAEFQDDVQQVLAENLDYDPNYAYGDDDDDEDMEDEEDESDYSDDDDITWKVRRAAAKAIEAMILSKREAIPAAVQHLGPLLISHFREREETVRNEILAAYITLLQQISVRTPHISQAIVKSSDEMSEDVLKIGSTTFLKTAISEEQVQIFEGLSTQKDRLLKAISKLLKKNTKSGPKCLELLTELIKAYPGVLEGYLNEVVPGIAKTLTEKTTTAQGKMAALEFITKTLAFHESHVFQQLLPLLSNIVVSTIEDPFYKVSGEGLILSTKFVDTLKECNDTTTIVDQVFKSVNAKFMANDTDQDVRERAVIAISHLVALFSHHLADKLPAIQEKLIERVSRDMTCQVAIRSFCELVLAGVPIPEENLAKILNYLSELLKKNSRPLRMASLTFLESLLKKKDNYVLTGPEFSKVLGELPNVISDNDLQVANQSLNCLTSALESSGRNAEPHLLSVLKAVVSLSKSPLVQGTTLSALMALVSAVVKSDISKKPSFEELLDMITSPIYEKEQLSRQAIVTIASSVSVVAEASNDVNKGIALVEKLVSQLRGKSSDTILIFTITALGELGRRFPQVYDNSSVRPEVLAIDAFNSHSEEMKGAAAHCLGALAVGNLFKFLPFILQKIGEMPKRQYLLLHALKEVIVWESLEESTNEVFKSSIQNIWKLLITNAGGQEEGTRSVVSECLGRLCSLDPQLLLPELIAQTRSVDPNTRAAVVSSVKYMLNDEKNNLGAVLHKHIGEFLELVTDEDLNVRKVVLVVLNSAAHNKPSLIRNLLAQLVPAVYAETRIRRELIREVEMGPFKHVVDDGLELRKCAFECMYTLLENCIDKLDLSQFVNITEAGITDPGHDVKLLNFLTLQKLASVAPNQVVQRLDKIADVLKAQLLLRPKANAVKQEVEKVDELKKAVVRALYSIKRIPGADRVSQFSDLQALIKSEKALTDLCEQVLRESQRAIVYDIPMEA